MVFKPVLMVLIFIWEVVERVGVADLGKGVHNHAPSTCVLNMKIGIPVET